MYATYCKCDLQHSFVTIVTKQMPISIPFPSNSVYFPKDTHNSIFLVLPVLF